MVKDEEAKQLMEDLSTSPAFLASLLAFHENAEENSIDARTFALWFFSQGYLSCQEFMKRQKMMRPFNEDNK